MKLLTILVSVSLSAGAAFGSWWWPFGGDDEPEPPRLSELLEKASLLIDDASDLAAEGKTAESVKKYREALVELDRVEGENPERAATPEFASLRNKRAYVKAAIDSMLLDEARDNVKAVSVTDTTELEKKFLALQASRKAGVAPPEEVDAQGRPKAQDQLKEFVEEERERSVKTKKAAEKARAKRDPVGLLREKLATDPKNRKLRIRLAGELMQREEIDDALKEIKLLLDEKPNDAAALNLRAACEAANGDLKAAQRTLVQAINNNPRDYNAYYNMANLELQKGEKLDSARRYYESGRAVGGPKDEELEKLL